MKNWLIYIVLNLFIFSFKILPRQLALRLGESLAVLLYYLSSRHRKITLDNLKTAYGNNIDDWERERIAKSSFKNLGRVSAEFAKMTSYTNEFIEMIVDIEGWENFENAVKKAKGIVFLTAHLGNWELMAYSQALRGYPGSIVARPLDNPVVEEFVQKQRTASGNKVIVKKNALKDIIYCLRKKEHVGILLDQNVAQQEGIFVDFFGKAACTSFGLAMIALKTDITIIPSFLLYKGNGRYKQLIGKEIEIRKSGKFKNDLAYNTALFTKVIESYIRQYPEQWFWVHRRWKTQPKELEWKNRKISIRRFEEVLDLKGIDNV